MELICSASCDFIISGRDSLRIIQLVTYSRRRTRPLKPNTIWDSVLAESGKYLQPIPVSWQLGGLLFWISKISRKLIPWNPTHLSQRSTAEWLLAMCANAGIPTGAKLKRAQPWCKPRTSTNVICPRTRTRPSSTSASVRDGSWQLASSLGIATSPAPTSESRINPRPRLGFRPHYLA
jgi:hypothetical protein